MNAPSVDIKDMLVADTSLSLTFATNLFVGKEPGKPDNCTTIYDTPGFPPYLGLGGEVGYEYPSVQIIVRNTKQATAWDLIERIKDSLHGRNHQTWNNTLYMLIACSSGPALLDWDDNGNVRFVINFNLQRRTA